MANEVDYSPHQYKGNGLTRDFPFDWKLIKVDEIVVELELVSTGNIRKLNIGSDYNVEINEVGGKVTLTTAPTEDYYVNISRDTSQYQSKGYSTSTGFQGSEIEKSFDQVSCNLQEMSYKINLFQKEFTEETEEKINNFETDVNNKIEQVNEAVGKLNRLDEILEECEGYATTSEEQSIIAQQQATEAKNSATMAEETLKNIQEELPNKQNKISYFLPSPYRIALFNNDSNPPLGDYEIDLSQYIPLDGYSYILYLRVYFGITDKSSIDRNFEILPEDKSMILCRGQYDGVALGNGSTYQGNITVFPTVLLSSNSRKLILRLSSTDDVKTFTSFNMYVHWAQRI